jgi:hypothetical protein
MSAYNGNGRSAYMTGHSCHCYESSPEYRNDILGREAYRYKRSRSYAYREEEDEESSSYGGWNSSGGFDFSPSFVRAMV